MTKLDPKNESPAKDEPKKEDVPQKEEMVEVTLHPAITAAREYCAQKKIPFASQKGNREIVRSFVRATIPRKDYERLLAENSGSVRLGR